MKKLTAIVFGSVALAVSAETYDASTGYVTLLKSDSYNKEGVDSFGQGLNWSDEQVTHSGTNYYVGSGLTLYCMGDGEFAGDSLVLGGTIMYNGNWKCRFKDCTLLPGSKIRQWYNSSGLNRNEAENEHLRVKGTAENPAVWEYDTKGENTPIYLYTELHSDETGWLKFTRTATPTNNPVFIIPRTMMDYHGIIDMTEGTVFRVLYARRISGGFVIRSGARLTCHGDDTVYAGSLHVEAGGTLDLSGAKDYTISDRLVLDPGAVVETTFLNYVKSGTPEKLLMFTLAPEAVAEGLPDFDAVTYDFVATTDNRFGPLPHMSNAVEVVENGTNKVYRTYKEIVHKGNYDAWQRSSLTLSDPSLAWSDGRLPEKGKDYWTEYTLSVYGTKQPYVFPGDSLTMNGGSAQVVLYDRDVTFDDLNLTRGGRVTTTLNRTTFHLRGTITCWADNANPSRFSVGDANVLHVDADIKGDGDVKVDFAHLDNAGYNANLTYAKGTIHFNGDNGGLAGKFSVLPNDPLMFGDTAIPLSSYSNITVVVASGSALGGALPSAAFDGFTLGNQCRLRITDDADFAETSRGWYFPGTGYVHVAEGKTATLRTPVTLGGTFVKEGAGTAWFSNVTAYAESEVGKKISVTQGAVGALSASAFDGVELEFAEGTELLVAADPEDAAFASKGFVHTASGSGISAAAGKVTVRITGADCDRASFKPFSAAICTVPASEAEAVAAKLAVKKPGAGIVAKLVSFDNGDGTVTLSADCGLIGMHVIVR